MAARALAALLCLAGAPLAHGQGAKVPLPAPRPPEIAGEAEIFPLPRPDTAPTSPRADAAKLAAPTAPALPTRAAPLPPARPASLSRPAAAEVDEEPPAPEAPAPVAAETPAPPERPPTPPAPRDVARPSGGGSERGLPAACAAAVAEGAIVAAADPGLSVRSGCALTQPVRLSAVRLADGATIAFKPAAILRCEMVLAVAEWTREDLATAIARLGTRLEAIKVAASYDCRPRNRIAGARMSEHGFGNALDVGGFEVEDRRTLVVEDRSMPTALQTAMKDSACTRFTTVLGPGSDGYHEDHVHVDLAKRRLDFKMCRWQLKGEALATRGPTARPPQPAPAAPEAPQPPPSADAAGAEQDRAAQQGVAQDGTAQESAAQESAAQAEGTAGSDGAAGPTVQNAARERAQRGSATTASKPTRRPPATGAPLPPPRPAAADDNG